MNLNIKNKYIWKITNKVKNTYKISNEKHNSLSKYETLTQKIKGKQYPWL